MKKVFETSSKAPINSVSTDAINFVMDNVFDWDSHNEHDGLRFTYDDAKTLARSLKTNLHATCPKVNGAELLEHYDDLIHKNWAGQFSDIKKLTHKVIEAFMEAEVKNLEPMRSLNRKLKGKINYMEKHYHEVSHAEELPVHVLSDALESKEDNARTNIESKTAVIQQIAETVGTGTAAEIGQVRKKRPGIFKILGM